MNQIATDYSGLRSLNNPAQNVAGFRREGDIGLFSPSGLMGIALIVGNSIELAPNNFTWRVAFSSSWSDDGLTFTQTATTLGNHPLVGTRTWSVSFDPNSMQITYGTQAYEQPRGAINSFNFHVAGSSAQQNIWYTYYDNLSSNYLPSGYVPSIHSVNKTVTVNPNY